MNQTCNPNINIHSANIQTTVSTPAIFVYIKVKSEQIESYKLSKNGFIQVTPKDLVTISFDDPNCTKEFTEEDIQILTVNDFLKM